MKKLQIKLIILVLLLLILLSLNNALQLVKTHFTHVDDIGVAQTLLLNDFNQKCSNYTREKNIIINHDLLCQIIKLPYFLTVIPRHWTYAPGQFWITNITLQLADSDYQDIKIFGRISSFIFHCLGLLSFYYLLRLLPFIKENTVLILMLVSIPAFSLEQQIYAAQMQSYAVGLFSYSIALIALIKLQNFHTNSNYENIKFSILSALSIAFQYQALLIIAAGFIVIFFNNFNKKIYLKKIFIVVFYFLITIGITGSFLLFNHVGKGVHWNAGPNSEYAIKSDVFNERVIEFPLKVIKTIPEIIYATLTPVEINTTFQYIYSILVILLIILGIIFLIKTKKENSDLKFLISMFFCYFLIIIGLYLNKSIALSPTRHSLYYLPTIVILSCYGIVNLKKYIDKFKFYGLTFSISISYLFFLIYSIYQYEFFNSKREDLLTKFSIEKLVNNENINSIIYDGWNPEIIFFTKINAKKIQLDTLNTLNTSCEMMHLMYPYLNEPGKYIWVSSWSDFDYAKNVLIDNIKWYKGRCEVKPEGVLGKIYDVRLILKKNSIVGVDLMNKTLNGTNQLYLYSFILY
jgi:hypothetical protein